MNKKMLHNHDKKWPCFTHTKIENGIFACPRQIVEVIEKADTKTANVYWVKLPNGEETTALKAYLSSVKHNKLDLNTGKI